MQLPCVWCLPKVLTGLVWDCHEGVFGEQVHQRTLRVQGRLSQPEQQPTFAAGRNRAADVEKAAGAANLELRDVLDGAILGNHLCDALAAARGSGHTAV